MKMGYKEVETEILGNLENHIIEMGWEIEDPEYHARILWHLVRQSLGREADWKLKNE